MFPVKNTTKPLKISKPEDSLKPPPNVIKFENCWKAGKADWDEGLVQTFGIVNTKKSITTFENLKYVIPFLVVVFLSSSSGIKNKEEMVVVGLQFVCRTYQNIVCTLELSIWTIFNTYKTNLWLPFFLPRADSSRFRSGSTTSDSQLE